jgi:hypothetical protein
MSNINFVHQLGLKGVLEVQQFRLVSTVLSARKFAAKRAMRVVSGRLTSSVHALQQVVQDVPRGACSSCFRKTTAGRLGGDLGVGVGVSGGGGGDTPVAWLYSIPLQAFVSRLAFAFTRYGAGAKTGPTCGLIYTDAPN